MENLPDVQSITTSNDGLRVLLGVAMGAMQADADMDLTAIKIVIEALRQGLQAHPRKTRYRSLIITALEEAEGWVWKAQCED